MPNAPSVILETSLYCDDLEANGKFYREVIGLETITEDLPRHVFFHCGRQVLLLFNPNVTSQPSPKDDDGKIHLPPHGCQGQGHVAFQVPKSSLDEWRSQLKQHHVEIETEIEWPHGPISIYFRDPAGNSVELATPGLWSPENVEETEAISE